MTAPTNNIFEVEPTLISKLEGLGVFSAVQGWSDLDSVMENPTANAKNKTAFVLYEGDEITQKTSKAVASKSRWVILLVVKAQKTQGSQAQARELAGDLIGAVVSALHGFAPGLPGWQQFSLDGEIGADYLKGGIATFAIPVSCQHILTGTPN